MAIVDDFKQMFPEFQVVDVDNNIQSLIDIYECFYPSEYTQCNKTTILFLLAWMMTDKLHHINSTPVARDKDSLNIQSWAASSVSETYDTSSISNQGVFSMFGSNSYGQKFLLLRSKNAYSFAAFA
jgi:hypothetical protein